jgi:hypothetical protein
MLISAALLLIVAPAGFREVKNKSHRLFVQVPGTTVTLDGTTEDDTFVYRSASNIWLMSLNGESEWYAYSKDDQELFTCQIPQWIPLPRALFLTKGVLLPCVPFTEAKAYDSHLVVTPEWIEFDSFEKRGRIRLIWP